MSIFKKEVNSLPPMPAWEEIVAHMQGESLSGFSDTVVRVISSRDLSKRIIVLRSEKGYFKTVYEEICVCDEELWICICNEPDAYPAWWQPVNSSINTRSFYGTEEEAIKEIEMSCEYMTFFA